MMGLLSSVKRRMSSRESSLQSNDRLATPDPPQHASSAPAIVRHQDENSVDGAAEPSSLKNSRLLISGLMRPSTSDVSPRIASSLVSSAEHAAVSTLTPVAGGDTPLSTFEVKRRPMGGDTRNRLQRTAAPPAKPAKAAKSPASPPKSPSADNSLIKVKDVLPLGLLVAKQHPSVFSKLPSLKETLNGDLLEVFRKKTRACGDVIFDWRPAAADTFIEEREAKRVTLQELMEIVSSSRASFIDQIIEDLIHMVSANIFRPLPPSVTGVSTLVLNDPEELEPILESSWPHLTLVYEILLRFVMSNEVNPKTAKKYIDHAFVLRLLDLFASEDPRERDYLKTIMHRVYGKVMALRAFIRKAIQHVFSRYIYENDSQHGVSELLEILGSIINGFAQPLKEEHKIFLQKSMIPLHKSRNLISYHQQLTYCMTQYIDKDGKLVEPIINGLLRYWPVTNTPKEVLFLNEVEEILEITPLSEFQKVMEPLFKQMALCIQSQHFQVSERVLFLWNNARIVRLINQNKNVLFPIVISALYKNTKEHWNQTVHGLTFNVCKLLAEADPHLFDQCNDENVAREKRRNKERENRRAVWNALQKNYAQAVEKSKNTTSSPSSEQDKRNAFSLKYCDDGT
eukprot:Gregarina_sp_Pseudo_9__4461@NODE_461_length_2790_cov_40_615776_g437_i0_p1_GENE_NODE_461_length_2790_cov_40_615776_g437_i0NODE_461_length_2790_cov_40_615776_g437_i0_p1_ORF_typecomplete_len626_score123_27B56/PF01603_20/2_1e160Peroxin3/PF04882_12/0_65Peroxin3/PF04882_12/1_3NAD1/PF18778_1/0_23_NODE_461_length_2790_cov_40_615776_g437_i01312008